jgi:hypothetical protein
MTMFNAGQSPEKMNKLDSIFEESGWHGRRYRRFDIAFPVRIRFGSGPAAAEIEGVSRNVSVGGLLVRSALSLPLHTPVTFVLTVHSKQAVRPVHLISEGKVVRSHSEESETGYTVAVKCHAPFTQLEQFLQERDGHNP